MLTLPFFSNTTASESTPAQKNPVALQTDIELDPTDENLLTLQEKTDTAFLNLFDALRANEAWEPDESGNLFCTFSKTFGEKQIVLSCCLSSNGSPLSIILNRYTTQQAVAGGIMTSESLIASVYNGGWWDIARYTPASNTPQKTQYDKRSCDIKT